MNALSLKEELVFFLSLFTDHPNEFLLRLGLLSLEERRKCWEFWSHVNNSVTVTSYKFAIKLQIGRTFVNAIPI